MYFALSVAFFVGTQQNKKKKSIRHNLNVTERKRQTEGERDRELPYRTEPKWFKQLGLRFDCWSWALTDPIPRRDTSLQPVETCNSASWADGRQSREIETETGCRGMEREGKHFLLIGFWPGRRLDCLQLRENLILNLLKEEKHRKKTHATASKVIRWLRFHINQKLACSRIIIIMAHAHTMPYYIYGQHHVAIQSSLDCGWDGSLIRHVTDWTALVSDKQERWLSLKSFVLWGPGYICAIYCKPWGYPTVFTDLLRMISIENYVFIITQSLTILLSSKTMPKNFSLAGKPKINSNQTVIFNPLQSR